MSARKWIAFWGGLFVFFSASAWSKPIVYLPCVGCYGSASFYLSEAISLFPEYEIRGVHIQTEKEISANYIASFQATRDGYYSTRKIDPNNPSEFEGLIRYLKGLQSSDPDGARLVRAIGGIEQGTYHSAAINAALGFTEANGVESRDLLRHKLLQQQAVGEKYRIPSSPVLTLADVREFIAKFPKQRYVVKPPKSSSGEHVYFVDGTDTRRFQRILSSVIGTNDHYGQLIDFLIIQPEIVGEEYVAETFTAYGETFLVGTFQYNKRQSANGRKVYFIDRPVDLASQIARELSHNVKAVAPQLSLRTGPGHWEWMKESATGNWYLIEMGGRVGGSAFPSVEQKIWGRSNLQLNLLHAIDPGRYKKEIELFRTTPPMLTDVAVMSLISLGAGTIRPGTQELFSSLPTFYSPAPYYEVQDGSSFKETVDLDTSPAFIFLAGETQAIKRDALKIVHWQNNGAVFKYESPSCALWLKKQYQRLHQALHVQNIFE